MAVVEKWGTTWLEIVWDGTSDHTITQSLCLRAIRFKGSAAGDQLCVRQRKIGEATIANWPGITLKTLTGDNIACMEPNPLDRTRSTYAIDYSGCTFGTPANIEICLVFEPM
jgi:hypothetical protein